jgi:hypothetical protein
VPGARVDRADDWGRDGIVPRRGRLKQFQSLGGRQTVQARAKIKETIEETLDGLPEAYTRTIFSEKCSRVFEHVYEAPAS